MVCRQPSTRYRSVRWLPVFGVACLVAATGCSRPAPVGPRQAAATGSGGLHVVMINGGGTPTQNYQSHLIHIQQLVTMLQRAGVAPDRMTIFSSDGSNPAPDLAVREEQLPPEFWRLRGTRIASKLRPPIRFVDSVVPGMTLEAATKKDLERWFSGDGRDLRPGDTLFLYVTDHGTKNRKDLTDNFITLWKDETLSVRELQALLEQIDPGVRVVMVMSQCFSGSFANLMYTRGTDELPGGNVCGYFSSTADRPAYGCYPENRGRENVGHSFHFIETLAVSGSFEEAHQRVLVSDATPDVPLRTSDIYLEALLQQAATAQGQTYDELVDQLLQVAWAERARWEPEIRLLDRIGAAYGWFSPRSLAELQEQTASLPDISQQLRSVSDAWRQASGDANQANLSRFLESYPAWVDRLDEPSTAVLDAVTARALADDLLTDLVQHTRANGRIEERLFALHDRHRAAAEVLYRMEVRLAVMLRMQTLLSSVAGRVYLDTAASPAERAAYERLRVCEDMQIPAVTPPGPLLLLAEPFPPFEDDVRQAQAGLPAWLGIQFRDASPEQQARYGMSEGAAMVMAVYPDSPAEKSGLQPGDFILGTPARRFTEPREVRSWTMLATPGTPETVEVLRQGEPRQLSIAPQPFPMKWPQLPGPPQIGSVAPKLDVRPYRGAVRKVAAGGPRLLFFWATWCAPCKAALPEVLAFERQRGTPVLAITDEPPERLQSFFDATREFPENVAVDEHRGAFLAYGVSGTPTFVLIDGNGRVQSYSTGYASDKGLGIEGWSWAKQARR